MSQTFDMTIIGAGAIGCTTAYFLTKKCLFVAIFDKDKLAPKHREPLPV